MYSYLIGKVSSIREGSIDFEVNNIGYFLFVSTRDKYVLNEEYRVYIYDVIKDDLFKMYGFLSLEDRIIFEKLLEVSGIGPKRALTIISQTTINELVSLIKLKNVKLLSKINGVGRYAETIIYHLSNKLDFLEPSLFKYQNVFLALKDLGYEVNKINEALLSLPSGLSDDIALKEALRGINNV